MSPLFNNVISIISELTSHHHFIYLCSGFVFGIFIYQLFVRHNYALCTFLHESSHAVMALLFFRKIERFVSTNYQGGYVKHSGGFGDNGGNLIILLAPYFFPLLTFFSILIRILIPTEYLIWSTALSSFCLAIDMQQNISEILHNCHSNHFILAGTNQYSQTDLARVGFIPSIIIIIILSFILYTLFFHITLNGFHGIPSLLNSIYLRAIHFISDCATLIIKYANIILNYLLNFLTVS